MQDEEQGTVKVFLDKRLMIERRCEGKQHAPKITIQISGAQIKVQAQG